MAGLADHYIGGVSACGLTLNSVCLAGGGLSVCLSQASPSPVLG